MIAYHYIRFPTAFARFSQNRPHYSRKAVSFYVTITQALQIAQRVPATAPKFQVQLACGFTPLHLQTFLTAHLQQKLPGRKVSIAAGLYGDLAGTIENLS